MNICVLSVRKRATRCRAMFIYTENNGSRGIAGLCHNVMSSFAGISVFESRQRWLSLWKCWPAAS